MADETFDAVICGGGNKALMLAMYLQKYAGMSVGIFERRHEIGGCLATEEISAPGFRGNTHANMIFPHHYPPLWRDFPEFWDYGGQWDQYLVSDGAVFRNNNTCLAIYSQKHDPTQERTAKEIARFSEKDAETWLKLWSVVDSEEAQRAVADMAYNPPELGRAPEVLERQMALFPKLLEAGLAPDSMVMAATQLRTAQEFFESEELQYCILRFIVSTCTNVNEASRGAEIFMMAGLLPIIGFLRGGTHQAAHACHQILVQGGCKFFTHAEATKFLIENGTCTGIRLADGSEVKARKLVVSAGLSPGQLVDLVGRDVMGEKICRRVDNLSTTNIGCLMWYSFALNEAARYKAAEFNPDINETMWLGLVDDPNPEHVANECHYARLGRFPPLEDYNPVVWCHSLIDPAYAPPGKHVAQCEMQGPPASRHTEREWLQIKKQFAEDMMAIWEKHAPNMTWDNIIGIDTNSPYDCTRMKNLLPDGNFGGIDRSTYQLNENRPTPELANHRTPAKNLYCTGSDWHAGTNASAMEAYNCYKIIATDMGLGKPWEEPGKEEPDSLVEQMRAVVKKAREASRSRAQL